LTWTDEDMIVHNLSLATQRSYMQAVARFGHSIEWIAFAEPPFAGLGPVLAYLGRYTNRGAVATNRVTRLANGQVDFTWKDYRHHGKTKIMPLPTDEPRRGLIRLPWAHLRRGLAEANALAS